MKYKVGDIVIVKEITNETRKHKVDGHYYSAGKKAEIIITRELEYLPHNWDYRIRMLSPLNDAWYVDEDQIMGCALIRLKKMMSEIK